MRDASYRITRHPIALGVLVVWSLWLLFMIHGSHWDLFPERWFMTLTMVVGSFVAGATSEGGGAVAFPVMTLWFGIEPHIARDFSIAIQAVGMMAASFTIFCLRVPVEWRAVLYAGLGGTVGIVLGLDVISGLLPPVYAKLLFVSVWLSFAAALYWINRHREREVRTEIAHFSGRKAAALFALGVVGGCISGITGSGLDILTFSLLVLRFRLCEKVATPTSVILMGTNALVGLLWRVGVTSGLDVAAWNYWAVCVPVVVLGAPAGAWFIRYRTRHFVAGFLYLSIAVQYVAALVILPMTAATVGFSAAVTLAGVLAFWRLSHAGGQALEREAAASHALGSA
jgi:uncharacterized membrane protein YfcA